MADPDDSVDFVDSPKSSKPPREVAASQFQSFPSFQSTLGDFPRSVSAAGASLRPPLFPIFPVERASRDGPGTSLPDSDWLTNPSFSAKLLPAAEAARRAAVEAAARRAAEGPREGVEGDEGSEGEGEEEEEGEEGEEEGEQVGEGGEGEGEADGRRKRRVKESGGIPEDGRGTGELDDSDYSEGDKRDGVRGVSVSEREDSEGTRRKKKRREEKEKERKEKEKERKEKREKKCRHEKKRRKKSKGGKGSSSSDSSGSDSSESGDSSESENEEERRERRRRRRKRKEEEKRRRKGNREAEKVQRMVAGSEGGRHAGGVGMGMGMGMGMGVRGGVVGAAGAGGKEYVIDAKGDRDNYAFGSLYRGRVVGAGGAGGREYVIFAKGDRDNYAFGSLHRLNVARYIAHPTAATSSTHAASPWALAFGAAGSASPIPVLRAPAWCGLKPSQHTKSAGGGGSGASRLEGADLGFGMRSLMEPEWDTAMGSVTAAFAAQGGGGDGGGSGGGEEGKGGEAFWDWSFGGQSVLVALECRFRTEQGGSEDPGNDGEEDETDGFLPLESPFPPFSSTTGVRKLTAAAARKQQGEGGRGGGEEGVLGVGGKEEEGEEEGETWDEYVFRRTREFNEDTRRHPLDEQLWLRFVSFQDEAATGGGGGRHRAAVLRQVVEKKAAVLERALQHVADSEAVALTYLHTCNGRDDAATLDAKWRSAIGRSPGSANLWRGYIRWQKGQFATFTVGKMRESLIAAIRALVGRRNQVWRELQQRPSDPIKTRQLAASEVAAVDMLVDSCRFEHQSGHAELAVALLQAETEYAVRPPPLPLSFSEGSKLRLFQAFWEGGGERVGEEGGIGWSAWLAREEGYGMGGEGGGQGGGGHGNGEGKEGEEEEEEEEEENEEEEEKGGWTGWHEIVRKGEGGGKKVVGEGEEEKEGEEGKGEEAEEGEKGEKLGDKDSNGEEEEEDEEDEEEEEEDEDEEEEEEGVLEAEVMERIKAGKDGTGGGAGGGAADVAGEDWVKDPGVWQRWAAEERRRESRQWQPMRADKGKRDDEQAAEEDEEEELERVVEYEDWCGGWWWWVVWWVVVVGGGEWWVAVVVSGGWPWCGTATAGTATAGTATAGDGTTAGKKRGGTAAAIQAVVERARGREAGATHSATHAAAAPTATATASAVNFQPAVSEPHLLLGHPDWPMANSCFNQSPPAASGAAAGEQSAAAKAVRAAKTEVKRLLKTRRQDLGLWAAYARLEAESGNLDAARKVLDTALASVAALPKAAAEATPLLVLAYTHIELSPTNHSANQHQRPWQQQGRQQSRKGRLHWSINHHWSSLHTLASFAASAPFSSPPPLPPQLDPSGLKESGRVTSPSSSWEACEYFPQAALIRARAGFHLKLQEAKKVIVASAAATAAATASAAIPTSSTTPPSAPRGAASTLPWSNGAIGSTSSSGSTCAGGPTQEERNRATAAVAVVLCASLFELLAAPSLPEGVAAAAAVMDGCTAAVLPGRRACCLPLEMLFERHASLLLHALPAITNSRCGEAGVLCAAICLPFSPPSFLYPHSSPNFLPPSPLPAIPPQQVRRVVLQGLKEFPSNTHLLGNFLRLESRSAFTNSIRRFFDQTTARSAMPLQQPVSWLSRYVPQTSNPPPTRTNYPLPPLQTLPPLTTPLADQSPGSPSTCARLTGAGARQLSAGEWAMRADVAAVHWL
ncbi:unnamed protein product [Closterium sp. NIES-65]|nr:unnamed protein product [Closterium sp. NIES-65]